MQRIISGGLAEERGLERIARLVARIIRGGEHQPVVFPSTHDAPRLLHRHVVQRQQRTVFAQRLEAVLPVHRLHDVPHLLLDIACRNVHFVQRTLYALASPFCRMQPILPLQILPYALAPAEEEVLVEPPAALIHIDGDDVQVVAVDVLMLIDHIRLVAVAQTVEVFPCYLLQFRVRQHIVGMRIDGDVQHRLLRAHRGGHEGQEALHRLGNIHRATPVVEDAVGGQQPSLFLVDLLPVVGERTVERLS